MDRTRIDRDLTEPNDGTPALDRAWAATRPAELRADDFDRIWAEVRRAYDARPAVLAMPRPARSRRTIALAAFGLAQAAAVLVAVWALNRPMGAGRPDAVRVDPLEVKVPVVVAQQDVEADETLILHLDAGRVTEQRRPASPVASDALALLDLPPHTPSDMLGFMEAQSR